MHFEPFSDGADFGKDDRNATATALVRSYAARLEAYCRLAPYNWFNFFDFWAKPEAANADHRTQSR